MYPCTSAAWQPLISWSLQRDHSLAGCSAVCVSHRDWQLSGGQGCGNLIKCRHIAIDLINLIRFVTLFSKLQESSDDEAYRQKKLAAAALIEEELSLASVNGTRLQNRSKVRHAVAFARINLWYWWFLGVFNSSSTWNHENAYAIWDMLSVCYQGWNSEFWDLWVCGCWMNRRKLRNFAWLERRGWKRQWLAEHQCIQMYTHIPSYCSTAGNFLLNDACFFLEEKTDCKWSKPLLTFNAFYAKLQVVERNLLPYAVSANEFVQTWMPPLVALCPNRS